jgi:hypothetical protein
MVMDTRISVTHIITHITHILTIIDKKRRGESLSFFYIGKPASLESWFYKAIM